MYTNVITNHCIRVFMSGTRLVMQTTFDLDLNLVLRLRYRVSCNNWSNIHASHAEFLQRLAQSAVLDSNLFRPAYFSTNELPAEAWLHGRLDPSHTHL